MSTKHTPGPWEAIISEEGIWVTTPNHDEPVICDLVARMSSYDEKTENYTQQYQEEDYANANLIAAAPELLEALQQCVARLEPAANTWDKKAYLVAKAAISKAIGEKEETA